jgi:hypothetical protein
MLTRTNNSFDTRKNHPSDLRSLRLRDAPVGAAALGSIVSAVLVILVGSSFRTGIPLSKALSVIILLFSPAILGAIYSLFFEQSKLYGVLGLLLAGFVLLIRPFTWVWLSLYFPFAFAFTVFCAIVRLIAQRAKR